MSLLQRIEILSSQLEKLSDIMKKFIPEEALKNEEDKDGASDKNESLPLPDYY